MKRYITCDICEALCGLEVELEGQEVRGIRGDPEDPLSRGHICPKALGLLDVHADRDRLRQPVRRQADGSWLPVSWDAALDEAADGLYRVSKRDGNSAVAVYSGNPIAHSYSALFGNLLLARALRTRNRFSATSADQLPHMLAALEMFGHQLLLPVPDLERTDLLVMLGANPAASNGSLMTTGGVIRRLKDIRRRGGRIVLIDPRRSETARHVDEHHFIRPGSDVLLLLALLQVLFEDELLSDGVWRSYTDGVQALAALVAPYSPERVAGATAIEAKTIRGLAHAIAASPSAAIYGRMGTCTQRFGGLNAWLLYALNIVTGNLDRPGGMMFATPAADLVELAARSGQRGHFDVRRSRVSGLPEFGGELPVSVLAEEIETPGEGQIRGLLTLAGNPVLSTPNGARLDRALSGLDFIVSLDWYRTATTRHANLILPPCSALERDHYGLAFHGLAVHNTAKYSPAALKGGGPDDWDIMLGLARRLADRRGGRRQLPLRLTLRLAERFGARRALALAMRLGPYKAGTHPLRGRLTLRKLERHPHGIDLGPLRPRLPERLYTQNHRIQLVPALMVPDLERVNRELLDVPQAATGQLQLIGRRHLRSNNTWLHNSERLLKGPDRCTLLIHPTDADARGISHEDRVTISSRTGELVATAQVSDEVLEGVVSLPHGWGHGRKGVALSVALKSPGVSVNDLTDERFFDELSGNAALNGVPVRVERG